jgi:hypothetical protein
VYFVIALTALNEDSGILNFFAEHERDSGYGQVEALEVGDGIVCRQEDFNQNGVGEGGVVLMIRYQA